MSGFRVGFGYDLHVLVEGHPLILGGLNIPHTHGLKGYSDADVLSHAIADAILGAAGLPDIGYFFPDTNPEYKGIRSEYILKKALDESNALGFSLVNVDSTIIAEEPKLISHIFEIKKALSSTLKIDPSQIGIKATTNEQIGPIGNKEAIAVHAVCLLSKVISNCSD